MATPVLVVDDSAVSRKMVIKTLPSEWDVDIIQAANGKEALNAYRNGKAHVIFLDLTMPVMDGYEVLETLKKEGLDRFVAVISADMRPIAQERVKTPGAIGFIKKPLQPEEIRNLLQTHGHL